LTISRPFILRTKNVSGKSFGENQTHILCSITLFRKTYGYEVMWENVVEPCWPEMTSWRKRISCWINKVTNTHSGYATLNAFPLQQLLHERA